MLEHTLGGERTIGRLKVKKLFDNVCMGSIRFFLLENSFIR
jgi:hypothetical protein